MHNHYTYSIYVHIDLYKYPDIRNYIHYVISMTEFRKNLLALGAQAI